MDINKIVVCCPSYKRPYVETKEYIPFIRVYVDGSEYDEYVSENPGTDIVRCEDGVQGNLCRVRNYILRKEFEEGADVVLLVDDDMKGIFYWERTKVRMVQSDEIIGFIYKYSSLADEWGAKFWGINVNKDKQVYRENTPFSTISYIGGPFQCFLRGNECWYDERLPLKEDYDMTLQQINRYRIALRVNKYFYDVKQSEQKGGCATYRSFEYEREQLEMLQRKWGADIVKVDKNNRSHNLKKNKRKFDYNPIIKVPIRGV